MVKAFGPQTEWTEPAGYPGAGTYYGHAGVTAHLIHARDLTDREKRRLRRRWK
jgi:hypothetical protein